MKQHLEMFHDEEAYSLGRKFIVRFGISNLGYGSTPEEAFANFKATFNL